MINLRPALEYNRSDFEIYDSNSSIEPEWGQWIEWWPKDADKFTVTVNSRAGKATGKFSSRYNIQGDTGEMEWIEWSQQVEK